MNICVAAALPRKYHQHNNPTGQASQSCKCTNSCSVPLFPNTRNFAPQCLLFKCVKAYRPHLVQKGVTILVDASLSCYMFVSAFLTRIRFDPNTFQPESL